jgi:hypothetical protein
MRTSPKILSTAGPNIEHPTPHWPFLIQEQDNESYPNQRQQFREYLLEQMENGDLPLPDDDANPDMFIME